MISFQQTAVPRSRFRGSRPPGRRLVNEKIHSAVAAKVAIERSPSESCWISVERDSSLAFYFTVRLKSKERRERRWRRQGPVWYNDDNGCQSFRYCSFVAPRSRRPKESTALLRVCMKFTYRKIPSVTIFNSPCSSIIISTFLSFPAFRCGGRLSLHTPNLYYCLSSIRPLPSSRVGRDADARTAPCLSIFDEYLCVFTVYVRRDSRFMITITIYCCCSFRFRPSAL